MLFTCSRWKSETWSEHDLIAVRWPHSQVTFTRSLQGDAAGHGGAWQGALHGCPHDCRVSAHGWPQLDKKKGLIRLALFIGFKEGRMDHAPTFPRRRQSQSSSRPRGRP